MSTVQPKIGIVGHPRHHGATSIVAMLAAMFGPIASIGGSSYLPNGLRITKRMIGIASRSKYTRHQGEQERARRLRQRGY